jgi:hypothetical protein
MTKVIHLPSPRAGTRVHTHAQTPTQKAHQVPQTRALAPAP